MIAGQTGINWLASKAMPELGTALPQLFLLLFPPLEFSEQLLSENDMNQPSISLVFLGDMQFMLL